MNPTPSSPFAAQLGGAMPPQDPLAQAPGAAAGLMGAPGAGGSIQALLAGLLGGQGGMDGQGLDVPPQLGEELADLSQLDAAMQAQASGILADDSDGLNTPTPDDGNMPGPGGLGERLMAALQAAGPKPPVPAPPAAGQQQPGQGQPGGLDMAALLGGMKGPPPGGMPGGPMMGGPPQRPGY